MSKKESFILHNSFYEPIKTLSDQELGQIFRVMCEYQFHDVEIEAPPLVKMAFAFIKNDLDNQKNDETYLYTIILSSPLESFIKIGVSSNIDQRLRDFSGLGYDTEIINSRLFKTRKEALLEEAIMHKKFSKFTYCPVQSFGGDSECFLLEIKKEASKKGGGDE